MKNSRKNKGEISSSSSENKGNLIRNKNPKSRREKMKDRQTKSCHSSSEGIKIKMDFIDFPQVISVSPIHDPAWN